MTDHESLAVTTPEGRSLEVLLAGDPDGFPLLFHYGTPTAAVADPVLHGLTADASLRMITYSRPGYGASTPRPTPGMIADDVQDSAEVLAALGVTEFVTLGWSGGGPRALGCAALLAAGCRAAATLAGVAPFDADGLDWFEGMGEANVEEFTAATKGAEAYEELLEQILPPLFSADVEQVRAGFGELLTPVDAAAMTGGFAELMVASLHHAGVQGVIGARDDGLALVNPWGFDVSAIHVPVAVWQGKHDAMTPYGHGAWLADNIPSAQPHLLEDEGHLSLVGRFDTILADLRTLAGI